VVIGAAFGKIVTALVDGIVMPLVGVALGGVSVSDWKYVIKPETVDAAGAKVAEVAVRYGMFIQTLIDFLIIAFVIFLVIKAYNRMRKPAAEVAAAPPEDVLLLREIRDSLKR
jgi:large conductance mechanosensitive channel